MREIYRATLAGAVIGALVTLPGLGNGTLWDNSETAYGEVAREILLRGDWIVLHFNGANWFVQPPLYFWLAAMCAKIFGLGPFALRLPSALATIAMGAMTAYAVARQAGLRAGIYSSAILSTCLMQAVVGRLAIMDALLDLSVALTIFWWFRASQTGRDRYFIYGSIAVAVGFLAKGPVAPAISLLVALPYWIWEWKAGGARPPSWRGWAGGILLFAAITAPWFIALDLRAGTRSLSELIGHYTFGRYTGTIENQNGPLWYYLPVVILGFFPWIAFVPSALAQAAGLLRSSASDERMLRLQQMTRLALVWSAMPLLFFSFAQTKLPNYIALELPALAVLTALYFDRVVDRARNRSVLVSTAAVPVTILLLAIAIVWFSRDNRLLGILQGGAIPLIGVAAAIFVGSCAAFVLLLVRRGAAAPYAITLSMLIAVSFIAVLELQAERFKPIPHLAAIIDSRRENGDAVAIQDVSGGNALLFYTRPPMYVLAPREDGAHSAGVDPRSVICQAQRTWLVAPAQSFSGERFGRTRRMISRWQKAALYLYAGPPCRSGST